MLALQIKHRTFEQMQLFYNKNKVTFSKYFSVSQIFYSEISFCFVFIIIIYSKIFVFKYSKVSK